jgi:hypothetical protein
MSTTVEKIILDVRALLDELTKKGVLIPNATVADLEAKGIRLVDMAQKELYNIGNIYNKFEITQKNPINMFGNFANFDVKEFKGTDQLLPLTSGYAARSYYFEADDTGSCIIEELQAGTWQTLTTIPLVASTSMVVYKGQFTPTTIGNLIRFRFTGTTYYKYQNVALFSEPFKLDRIPNYRPWIKYDMPGDFRMTDAVIEEFPERQYQRSSNYKWEGFKELWVNYYYIGTIRVIYKPIPTTITSKTDVLQVDDVTVNAITYYVGAKLAAHDYPELTNFFEQKYNEIILKSVIRNPSSEETIVDVYGGRYGRYYGGSYYGGGYYGKL